MSTKPVIDDGGRAFPYQVSDQSGMSLRDYLAAKAAQGICVNVGRNGFDFQKSDVIAGAAYRVADAMLEARKQ